MLDTPVGEPPRLGVAAPTGAGALLRSWMTLDRLLLLALLAVVLAPLGLDDRSAAASLLATGAGTLLILRALVAALGRPRLPMPLRRLAPALACFGLAVAWTMVQAMPFVPAAWQHPLWSLTGDALGGRATGSIALDRAVAIDGVLSLLAHFAVFWTALGLARDGVQARILATGFALAVAVLGFGALAAMATHGEVRAGEGDAGLYGLGLLAAVAVALDRIGAAAESGMRPRRALRLAGKALAANRSLLAATLSVSALVAGLLGHVSDLTAVIAGLLSFLPAIAVAPALRFGGHRLVLVAVVGAVALLAASAGTFATLVLPPATIRDDSAVSAAALAAARRDAAWLGFGLGSFDAAIKAYRDLEEDSMEAARPSLYGRLLVETGRPASASFAAAAMALLTTIAWGLRTRRRNAAYPALAIAASLLIGLLATGSVLLPPALTAGCALLLGIGYAQSFKTRRD